MSDTAHDRMMAKLQGKLRTPPVSAENLQKVTPEAPETAVSAPLLEWLESLPGGRGYYSACKRYSVANVTIAGRVYWECWKLMPKASWFTVLACMLPSEDMARAAAQKDSQK